MAKKDNNLNVPASDLPEEKEPHDFRNTMSWRVLRIGSELVNGFQYIADFKKTVTIFGSARLNEGNSWYEEARKLGRLLSESGFAVVTGGGPGIMEGANRGAKEAGGDSLGLNIQLPFEQRINPYVTKPIGFHYFFTRKLMLTYSAEAYVYFPGGYGTMDEFFEIIELVQTKKIPPVPIVLVGEKHWNLFLMWIHEELLNNLGAIDKEDLEIFDVVNTAEEAVEIIKSRAHPRHEFEEKQEGDWTVEHSEHQRHK